MLLLPTMRQIMGSMMFKAYIQKKCPKNGAFPRKRIPICGGLVVPPLTPHGNGYVLLPEPFQPCHPTWKLAHRLSGALSLSSQVLQEFPFPGRSILEFPRSLAPKRKGHAAELWLARQCLGEVAGDPVAEAIFLEVNQK